MANSKYLDGWYKVTPIGRDELVFRCVDGRVGGIGLPMESFESHASKIEMVELVPITRLPEDGKVHIVLCQGPYADVADIVGVYFNKEDAVQNVNELDRKYGRGYTVLISRPVLQEYVGPPKPQSHTYEVRATIEAWANDWQAGEVSDDKMKGQSGIQRLDRGVYRIYVRAIDEADAIAQGKALFVAHINA